MNRFLSNKFLLDDDPRGAERDGGTLLVVDTQAILGLLQHPLRQEILRLFVEADEPLSPDRVSKELGERLNNVSYHVLVLAKAGALTLIEEQPVGGALRHFYVAGEAVTGERWVREALGLPERRDESGDDDA